MRVTGGIYSGRQVKCPKGVIRPSMDRMRESVFSILGNMEGLSFLDMFSGSGIIGINGAAAHKAPVGSLIIIAAYAQMTPDEAANWHPTVIFPKNNRL